MNLQDANLLDMLDQLEAGIAALSARAANGNQAAFQHVSRKSRGKRKKVSGRKKARTKQLSPVPPATDGASVEPAPRVIGKRQALGRSLMQLRRPHGDTPGPH